MQISKQWLILIILGLLMLSIMALKEAGYGLSYQATASMPKGWYWMEPIRGIDRGEIVFFKPNASVEGYLLSHHWLNIKQILMKQAAAIPGDDVCIQDHQVYINHQATVTIVDNYAPGKPLPHIQFCRTLAQGEYWLQSDHVANSFDSRYFGPVNQTAIIAKAVPV